MISLHQSEVSAANWPIGGNFTIKVETEEGTKRSDQNINLEKFSTFYLIKDTILHSKWIQYRWKAAFEAIIEE